MQEKTLTVQEALNELKVLDSRIYRKTHGGKFVGVKSKEMLVSPNKSRLTVDGFISETESEVQSISDLINYRKALRSAVILSNGRELIKVGDKELTVAEAIEYKNSIDNERGFVNKLSDDLKSAEITASNLNEKLEKNTLEKERLVLGGEKDRKGESEILEALRKEADKSKAEVVVPKVNATDLSKYVEDMRDELDYFESNIDFILTASNVTTTITVEW